MALWSKPSGSFKDILATDFFSNVSGGRIVYSGDNLQRQVKTHLGFYLVYLVAG